VTRLKYINLSARFRGDDQVKVTPERPNGS
jgi:hypothetical protein